MFKHYSFIVWTGIEGGEEFFYIESERSFSLISIIMSKYYYYLLPLLFALGGKLPAQTLPAPTGMTCEFLRAPEDAVITDRNPEFSWFFPASGGIQAAWRVLVATSPALLKEDFADAWDSKKVSSDQSVNIVYDGNLLLPHQTYWWQVKVWSANGLESAYSQPQRFNTGNFDRSDVEYPGQSRWVELSSDLWVSEDRQKADFHRINPISTHQSENGNYFVSFEKSVIGILEFTATTDEDSLALELHLGERKNEDHTVNKKPGRSNIGYAKVEMTLRKGTHHYIVKLPPRKPSHYLHTQKLAPHYPEVLPFRYAEFKPTKGQFRLDESWQAALFYYFDDQAGEFTSSDEKLNQVYDLCKYTLKATPFLGVYADGNRERMPYEADAYIQQLGHYSVDREYAIGRYTTNFLLDHASWPTEWQMHVVLMAWEDYMQTGNAELLAARYEDIRRKTLIDLAEENGLISTRKGKKTQDFLISLKFPGPLEQFRDIVDWPQGPKPGQKPAANQSPKPGGETDGFVFNDFNAVVNAFHYRTLVLMRNIAEVLGKEDEKAFFEARAKLHKKSYLETFLDPEKGYFVDGESTDHSSLHANMFPMVFGLVPDENVASVAAFMKSRGMACSVYGSQYLLDALYMAGEADYALELMTSDSKRSWLNMLQVGSSMTTEAWDEYFKPNLTWNHAWGSAPANIAARRLLGIMPLEAGYKRFVISPQPGTLNSASIDLPCMRGTISCALNSSDSGWKLDIDVPGNSEAELWLPSEFSTVTINGESGTIERVQNTGYGSRNVFILAPGRYEVSAR